MRLGRTRREILTTALAGAAGMALAPLRLSGQTVSPQTTSASGTLKLADDLFLLRLPGQTNVVAHTTGAGVILVDGASASASGDLMKAVAELPGGRPVQTLFNTHWHPEQTGA